MTDSAYRVQTTSRLAQWRINDLASSFSRKSDPFKIGNWNWHLSLEKNRTVLIKLYPEVSNFTKDNPPVASFIIRIVSSVDDRKVLIHPGIFCLNILVNGPLFVFLNLSSDLLFLWISLAEVIDKQLKNSEDFVWAIEFPLTGKFIIDIEFLDLKTPSPNGGDLCSIWGATGNPHKQANATALTSLGRMFSEGINTDLVINASDGSIGAHRAVLASRSPFFNNMFSNDLKEKELLTTISITDMSIEACHAFLGYIYGNIHYEEFLNHRLCLLRAADKYGILDLKEACHESLMDDIDTRNVLERLQNAFLYQLPGLKCCCMRYLVKFGKICDIKDELNGFLQCADRELISEVFYEVLAAWKGF